MSDIFSHVHTKHRVTLQIWQPGRIQFLTMFADMEMESTSLSADGAENTGTKLIIRVHSDV